MAKNFYSIREASAKLGVGPDALRSLARKQLIATQVASDGSTLVHVPEAAVALGADLFADPDDIGDIESASLALVQRRIKRIDIQTERDRLAHQERLGEVVPKSEVQRERLTRIRVVRAAILGMARTLPPLLVDQPYNEIRAILDKESRRIVSLFAGQQEPEDGV